MIEINNNKNGVLVIIKDNKSQFNQVPTDEQTTPELREYGVGAQILRDLGVRRMLLLTNSKQEIIGLEGFDIRVIVGKKVYNKERKKNILVIASDYYKEISSNLLKETTNELKYNNFFYIQLKLLREFLKYHQLLLLQKINLMVTLP